MRLQAVILMTGLAAGSAGVLARAGHAQELADFDYENLAFRGFSLEVGYVWPDKVEPVATYGVRMDLGYLGPGLRIVPSITYWSSRMKAREVGELESRLDRLIAQTQPGVSYAPVTFGLIDWSDLALALDAHVVWRVPYGLLTFAGAGASIHFLKLPERCRGGDHRHVRGRPAGLGFGRVRPAVRNRSSDHQQPAPVRCGAAGAARRCALRRAP